MRQVNRRAAFELPLNNVPLDELENLTKQTVIDLAQASPEWDKCFASHEPDLIFLSVSPKCRAELDVVCHSLEKERKAKKKKRDESKKGGEEGTDV